MQNLAAYEYRGGRVSKSSHVLVIIAKRSSSPGRHASKEHRVAGIDVLVGF